MVDLRTGFQADDELQRRRELLEELKKTRAHQSPECGPFPAAEEMIREDRER
jgi:hypothetical protein